MYGLIQNGVVTDVECVAKNGYVPIPAGTVSGYVQNQDGTFSPPNNSAASTQAQQLRMAVALLDQSDRTMCRCIENGVTVPTAWASYRKALRTIVQDEGAGTLPTQPPYPTGT